MLDGVGKRVENSACIWQRNALSRAIFRLRIVPFKWPFNAAGGETLHVYYHGKEVRWCTNVRENMFVNTAEATPLKNRALRR